VGGGRDALREREKATALYERDETLEIVVRDQWTVEDVENVMNQGDLVKDGIKSVSSLKPRQRN
jgi:hypothetical protein